VYRELEFPIRTAPGDFCGIAKILMMTIVGSAGIGLVWGWLAGWRHGPPAAWRPLALWLLFTILMSLFVFWLADGRALTWFLGAAVGGFAAHFAWRESLTDK